jgi:predicted acyltransferase
MIVNRSGKGKNSSYRSFYYLRTNKKKLMQKGARVLAIDIMRGLTLFLMLFVNDLFVPGVPGWLVHTEANFDGMGLADWVFPGFLFMVGMAVPFAVQSRLKIGDTWPRVLVHIFVRTISLLIIGIFMMNSSRLNPDLAGISKNLWAILMYISVFLIWNQYRNLSSNIQLIFKAIGLIGLIALAAVFRSGTPESVGWMQTGWWGILGLIGWGYLSAAVVYLLCKDNLLKTSVFWLLFLALNILSQLGMLDVLNPVKPVFGVILSGNVPLIVVTGLVFSLLLRNLEKEDIKKFIVAGVIFGVVVLISGFVLRNWFIISKIKGTPSWAMICNGTSILVFMFLYFVIDVLGKSKWAAVFKPAGQNSLTTYLAPDVLYHLIWMSSIPVLFYKQSEFQWVVVLGSVVWAFAMIGFAALLSKIGIRLKL